LSFPPVFDIFTPEDEEGLVDGCRELVLGNEANAFEHFKNAVHLADGAYLAGFLTLKKEQLTEAADYLATAAEKLSGPSLDLAGVSIISLIISSLQ